MKRKCACGKKYEVTEGKKPSQLCPTCRYIRDKETRQRRYAREGAELWELAPDPPKPKPKRKPIMTDAEQQAHDLALADRLARECGYGCGPVRHLTREEIERVAGEITPIELIPAAREW